MVKLIDRSFKVDAALPQKTVVLKSDLPGLDV